MFVISRILLGMGGKPGIIISLALPVVADNSTVTISQGNCPLLVTELAHTQDRANITAMYNSNWYLSPNAYLVHLPGNADQSTLGTLEASSLLGSLSARCK